MDIDVWSLFLLECCFYLCCFDFFLSSNFEWNFEETLLRKFLVGKVGDNFDIIFFLFYNLKTSSNSWIHAEAVTGNVL